MLRPFFYWVYKTLPLVYDDSLSYMELLSKVLWHLNKNTEKTNEISKLLAQLTEFVNNYFDSADFEQIVAEKLDEMAESGTLDTMLSEIANSTKFIPTDDEHDAYVTGISIAICDWFANMASGTTDSVVGNPVSYGRKYAAVYSDDYDVGYQNLLTYDAIIDDIWTFGKDPSKFPDTPAEDRYDTISIGGLSYPVLYMNCVGFATMITKGRSYINSPWAVLYNNSEATGRDMALKCMEYGDMNTAPWTFDCLNVLYTWRMASILKGSGCTPKLVAKKINGTMETTDNLKYLRDGDIVFFGNPDNTDYNNRYLNIYHCAMYFKTLEKLNQAASVMGFTLKPWDDDTSVANGYIVHCTGGTGEGSIKYNNVFRVDTLDSYIGRANHTVMCYGSQVSANALNSSKEMAIATGTMPLFTCDMIPGRREGFDASAASLNFNTVRAFLSGTSDGTYSYGQYRYRQVSKSVVEDGSTVDLNDYIGPRKSGIYVFQGDTLGITYVHAPELDDNPMTTPVMLEVHDCYQGDGLTLQSFTILRYQNPKKYERTINNVGTASDWQEIF